MTHTVGNALSAAYGSPRAGVFAGSYVVGSRASYAQATQAVGTVGTSKAQDVITQSCSDIRVVLGSWYPNEVDGPNAVIFKAALEVTNGGTVYPLTFRGQRSVTCDPNGIVISDPLPIELAAGTQVFTRIYQNVTDTTTQKVLVNMSGVSGGNGGFEGFQAGDVADSGTISTAGGNTYGHIALLADRIKAGQTRKPVVIGIGDSISMGTGWVGSTYAQRPGLGWLGLGLGTNYGYLNIAKAGESAATFAVAANRRRRAQLITGADIAVVMYGNNDWAGSTTAQVQANLTAIWQSLKDRGLKVIACTPPPPSPSTTDGYTTVANQVANATYAPKRLVVNNWIRNYKANGLPVDGYLEMADSVESSRDSGLWAAPGGAALTADGIHPNNAGHTLMGGVVQAAITAGLFTV